MILTFILFSFSSGHELTGQFHELDHVDWASHWIELSPMAREGQHETCSLWDRQDHYEQTSGRTHSWGDS
jgi:hypothetical protein